jgi:hypothetical protein
VNFCVCFVRGCEMGYARCMRSQQDSNWLIYWYPDLHVYSEVLPFHMSGTMTPDLCHLPSLI